MKKRSRLSRALSILLAMLMILSNSAITTYADIIGGVSQQSAGSLEVEVQVTTDGTTIDTSHSGSIYMYLQGDNNHRILKKVDISNGVGSVSADQLYDQNGQNPSPVNPNADYTITFFEYTGNSQLQENQNYEHVQQHEKKKVGIGDYTLGDCKLITIPSSVRSGTKATVVMKAMGKTEASYSAIDSNLGVANDFGAFVKTLSIGADVEATLAANTVVSLGHSYNFSDNNYKAVNNKIIITKTFTDKDGKPKANASITLKLYRDKELVGTQTVTTGSDGKATAEFQHLLYGNYTFYEVINNEEIKVDGKTEEGINVTYTGNAGIIIENRGFSNYSYFNNVEVSGNDLDHARGGFIVLDNAYEAHKNDNMTNARIEKAGENEFPQIDFDTYFSTTLPNVSKSIAAMKSSSDVQVYYVKASELKHDMDISSNGNKYIIMNVDMSDVGSAFTLPGQYKIDGTAIQANFENQKESQILWNFYDYNTDKVYEGTITQGSKMTGIILAPKCTVNGAPGNLGGTVIADTYNHTTGEIHGVRPYVESQIKNAAVKNSEKETKEAVANIYVKKTFADGDATQKFNFVLTTKNNAPVPANGTKLSISQSDGIKSFGEIKYTQAGTYTYTITEKNDGAAGVTYDGNTWTVTVNVPEDFSTPTVTYVKDKNTTNTTGAEFVNTYTEQKGNLSIKKVAGANTNLEGKTFYFKVTGPDNYSEVKELVYGNGKDSITISDLKPGDYTVTEVTDSKGTTEVKGNQSFPYQVSGDGKITVKAGQTPEISVTNTSVLGKIKVTKKVIGKENSKDKFYVALFKADKKTKVDNQPVKEITAGQTVTFENLVPGTYYVFETDEDGNKLNDTVVNGYIIPKDGTKTTIINDQKSTVPEVGVTLTNKWLETSLSLVGGKILTNITEDQAQKANFTFYVYKKGTNSNPVATGSYKAGKIEFTSISYDLKDLGGSSEKVFEYEIKEDIPSDAVNGVKNQIHYDTKIIPAAVTVELSSEELKITKVEVNGKEITSSSGIYDFSSVVAFENYIANGTDAVVSVIKRINNGYVTSCDKKFRFTLNKADNETNSGYTDPQFNTPFTSSSVEITGAGRAEFAKIYFNKVGYYRYTLTEDNLAATGYEGYQKDSSIYNVTIHVEGINNKQLTATVFYQKNGEDSYEAEFNNTYTDTEAEIEFTAKKVLPERNLKDKEFKFEVKDADGKVVSEGSNDVTGKITFNNKLQITLGQMQGGEEKGNIITKDFTYTVSEKDGKDTAIKYDTPKSITVHASYDKFTGKLSLSLDDDAKDVIFTNHYDTKAEIAFTAKKVLPERNLKDKEFKFEVKDADGKVVSKGSNDATGKITFNEKLQITLSQMQGGNEEGNIVTKDFTYTVSEKEGNDTAIDYDLSEKSITVHASYNKTTGELTLSLDNNAKSVTFTNHYDTSASIGFNATKKLTGRKLADGEFTFTLAREDGTQEVTEVNDADGNISFGKDAIRVTLADMQDADGGYAAEKTFTYLLTEQPGAEGSGLTYDTTPKTVKVKAAYDKATGKLALALDKDSQDITITNKYTDSDSVALNGVKYLEGRSLKAGEFTFTVTDEAGKEVTTGTNNAAGQITFKDNLKYDLEDLSDGKGGYLKEKTYTYKVKETPGTEEAVTYDNTVKTVEVKVTHDAESGKVTAELTGKSEALIFKNSYDTSASIGLNGTKTLTGRTQKAGEFHFEVKDSAGNLAATGTNDADGNINFDKAIQITLADMKDGEGYAESRDFIYTVTEVTGKAEGVTYDSAEKTVKIHAAYDPAEGKLTLSIADDSQPIKFTNRYHAAGQLVINGIKYVNGEELNAAQKKVLAGNVEFKLERAEVTDGQTGEFKEIQTAALTEEGTFSFKTQNYTEKNAGKTYVYQISESKADAAGFDIDSTVYTYTVSVGDNGDGTLNITALDGDGKHVTSPITVTFNNEYHASGQAQLNGTKTLLGNRSGDIKEGEFTFQVLDEDGNEVTTGKTLAADETGKAQIAFEPISYTEKNAGKTYTYTVQEAAGEDKNITYDTTIYVVTVKVSDNLDGTLETEVTYPEGFENGLTFTNSYKASGAATLKTTKTLEGRTAALAANEFVFSLYEVAADGTRTPVLDKDGNPMRAFNDAEGNVIFGEISYTQDDQGTHNYEITEEAGNDSAVTYDKEPVKATVTVSDKDGSGVLNAEAVYEKDGHTSFRNEYHANGKITFAGVKKLTGKRAAKIKDGEFTFTVKDDATGETVATGKTKDGGVIEFTEISYTEKDKGEHTYTITEDKGSDSSITYSEESVKVTVNVTDSNNGSLEATATYPEGGATFTNAYNAAGEVVLKASKTLEGSTLAADQFSFELKDEQGNVLQTKKNDADGKVTFDSLKYTEKDIDKTYTYTVSEVNNDITGVTYDNDVYNVKVQITDSKDSNGTLNITETSEKDGDVVEEITFANTFAGTVKLIKTSTEGRTLPGAEFALYAKNDKGEYDLYTADNEKGLYTTDAKGQINVENLPADDYYFIETAAPDGYKIRKADDGSDQKYSFKIGIEDGDAGVVENAKVNAELTVQNDINGTNSITVTKKITYIDPDTFDEFEMTWPKDQIFYVNLFTDPEGTIPYRTSTPKAFTVSENSSGTATFENVSKGTYYVFETDAEGNSIPMDEEMLDSNGKRYSATVDGDGTNQVELDVKTDAEEGKINLINRYFDMPGGAAYKGWINISKNILKGTDQIDVDDTFYAGIFTKTEDGEYDLYSVVTLANNDTVKTEVTLGGENGDQPITYYVYETDEQGNRIDQNEFAYTVTGEGEVSLDKSNTTADITITNTLSEQYSLLIRKVDENKDALVGAQFQITDGNGNVTDTWTSTLENHPVVLEPGTYKLSELVAPDGYKPGSEVTITVDDEGGISIESEVDGEADFDEDEDGILDYINYPETTITPTATPSAKTTPTGNQTTSRTSVKTGDDTPIALYILLLAVAACAAGGAVTVSRKKRKNK